MVGNVGYGELIKKFYGHKPIGEVLVVVMGTCFLRCRVGPELRVSTYTVVTFLLAIASERLISRFKGFELGFKDSSSAEAMKFAFVQKSR